MTDMTANRTPVRPRAALPRCFRHARYVIGENPVTGLAFGLFVLIVIAALIGPWIVPYNPLASDTARRCKPPSLAHLFGTDQLGRDIFSRVVAATQLDFTIAVLSVVLVFLIGGVAGVAAGFFGGWTDRIVGRIADTIMAFPLFVLAMGIVAALGNTVQNIVLATAIINFPLYARVARAEANVRRDAGFVEAARLVRQQRMAHPRLPDPAQHVPDHGGADVAHHGLRHSQRRGLVVHRSRRAAADAGMGHHGRRRRRQHHLRRMVDRVLSRRRADDRRVLLQSAGRRVARHCRSAEAYMTAAAGAERRGTVRRISHPLRHRARGGQRQLLCRQRRNHRARRRIRLRQISHRLCGDGHPRSGRPRQPADAPCSAASTCLSASQRELAEVRGRKMAMIFQNPRTALNPIRQVGRQIADVLIRHGRCRRRRGAPAAAVEMLRAVGITDPVRRAKTYPFEMSGGMCQRVMIAIALAAKPSLLIADEPTTGLDVTTQAVIMDLIIDLAQKLGMATIFITHDLALAGQRAARIVVMHAGHVVETAPTRELFANPRHPYTAELIAATPDSATSLDALASIPGSLPDLRRADLPPCRYSERCPRKVDCCAQPLPAGAPDAVHTIACWNPVPERGMAAPKVNAA